MPHMPPQQICHLNIFSCPLVTEVNSGHVFSSVSRKWRLILSDLIFRTVNPNKVPSPLPLPYPVSIESPLIAPSWSPMSSTSAGGYLGAHRPSALTCTPYLVVPSILHLQDGVHSSALTMRSLLGLHLAVRLQALPTLYHFCGKTPLYLWMLSIMVSLPIARYPSLYSSVDS